MSPRVGDAARIVRKGTPLALDHHGIDLARRLQVCEGKRRYRTLGGAENVARRMRRDGHGEDVEEYPCELCGGFHVGHRGLYEDNGGRNTQ